MFPKRFVLLTDVRLGHLIGHITIRDFWDVGQEEHPCEHEDEYPNGEIYPLHAFQRLHVVCGLCEEGI